MEVEAHVFYWTHEGMREFPGAAPERSCHGTAYVERNEVIRLLEEAHRRGYEAGKNEGHY